MPAGRSATSPPASTSKCFPITSAWLLRGSLAAHFHTVAGAQTAKAATDCPHSGSGTAPNSGTHAGWSLSDGSTGGPDSGPGHRRGTAGTATTVSDVIGPLSNNRALLSNARTCQIRKNSGKKEVDNCNSLLQSLSSESQLQPAALQHRRSNS